METIPRISLRSSMFNTVVDGEVSIISTDAIEVVVVGANPNLSKAWYSDEWSLDSSNTTPDCFTLNGLKPDTKSLQPQNDLCASCHRNSWGSRVTPHGTRTKSCADKKRLAVVLADEPEGMVYLLEVTATSLTELNKYDKQLKGRGIASDIVKTSISFAPNVSFPKLNFKFGGFINDETQPAIDKLFGSEQVKQITGEIPVRVSISSNQLPVASDFGFEDETGFTVNLGGSYYNE